MAVSGPLRLLLCREIKKLNLLSLEASVQSQASEHVQNLEFKVQNHEDQTLDPKLQTLDARVWLGRGQCIEQYGAGEPYMPVLEAFGRLCRGAHKEEMRKL